MKNSFTSHDVSPSGDAAPLNTQQEEPPTPLPGADNVDYREQPKQWFLRIWQHRVWSDTWLVECLSLIACIGCILAIGIVLMVYNGKSLPDLPYGITMNAVISVLATASKSNLLLIVASSISQLKWVWYQKSRRLDDIQLFEDAAKGPMGSLQVLLRHGVLCLASLGAVILILSLAFEPFIQQALVYPISSDLLNSSDAVASQARTFLVDDHYEEVRTSVLEGLFSTEFVPPISCPTSNCTWDTFQSLGLCSTCGKAEPFPQLENCTWDIDSIRSTKSEGAKMVCNLTYANINYTQNFTVSTTLAGWGGQEGRNDTLIYMVETPTYLVSEIYPNWSESNGTMISNQSFHGISNPLLAIGVTNLTAHSDHIAISDAQTCVLNFCVGEYTFDVINGGPMITMSKPRNGNAFHPKTTFSSSFQADEYWCWSPDGEVWNPSITDPIQGNMFYADEANFAFCTLGWFRYWNHQVAGLLVGNTTKYGFFGCPMDSKTPCEVDVPIGSMVLSFAESEGTQQIVNLGPKTVLANIAKSLTRLAMSTNLTPIYGNPIVLVAHVRVRWSWLILPVLLVFGGIGFFLSTILATKRHRAPLWKSSVLAILFHGLDSREIKAAAVGNSVQEMDRTAASMLVSLDGIHDADRISLKRTNVSRPYESTDTASLTRRKPSPKSS